MKLSHSNAANSIKITAIAPVVAISAGKLQVRSPQRHSWPKAKPVHREPDGKDIFESKVSHRNSGKTHARIRRYSSSRDRRHGERTRHRYLQAAADDRVISPGTRATSTPARPPAPSHSSTARPASSAIAAIRSRSSRPIAISSKSPTVDLRRTADSRSSSTISAASSGGTRCCTKTCGCSTTAFRATPIRWRFSARWSAHSRRSIRIRSTHRSEAGRISVHRLLAKLPTIAAYTYKKSIGQPFIYPRTI